MTGLINKTNSSVGKDICLKKKRKSVKQEKSVKQNMVDFNGMLTSLGLFYA